MGIDFGEVVVRHGLGEVFPRLLILAGVVKFHSLEAEHPLVGLVQPRRTVFHLFQGVDGRLVVLGGQVDVGKVLLGFRPPCRVGIFVHVFLQCGDGVGEGVGGEFVLQLGIGEEGVFRQVGILLHLIGGIEGVGGKLLASGLQVAVPDDEIDLLVQRILVPADGPRQVFDGLLILFFMIMAIAQGIVILAGGHLHLREIVLHVGDGLLVLSHGIVGLGHNPVDFRLPLFGALLQQVPRLGHHLLVFAHRVADLRDVEGDDAAVALHPLQLFEALDGGPVAAFRVKDMGVVEKRLVRVRAVTPLHRRKQRLRLIVVALVEIAIAFLEEVFQTAGRIERTLIHLLIGEQRQVIGAAGEAVVGLVPVQLAGMDAFGIGFGVGAAKQAGILVVQAAGADRRIKVGLLPLRLTKSLGVGHDFQEGILGCSILLHVKQFFGRFQLGLRHQEGLGLLCGNSAPKKHQRTDAQDFT